MLFVTVQYWAVNSLRYRQHLFFGKYQNLSGIISKLSNATDYLVETLKF